MKQTVSKVGVWLAWLVLLSATGVGISYGAVTDHSLAVIGSSELRETGLADLSVAALSNVEGLRLVERERLDVVAREYEASMFSEKARASDRIKLGRLVGADTLVLLSLFGSTTNTWLKMVVSDCHTGVRLRMESWAFDKSRSAEVVERIKATILDVRKAYPRGVAQVVGVAPFVSRNLVHDYDPLQNRYAYLLQQTLTSWPGVAVIETEEALALQNELALAGPERIERIVPVLVEGEFIVEAGGTSTLPQITFTVRIARPPSPPTSVRRGPMPLAQAGAFLSAELPQHILRDAAGSATQVSPERQFDWLVERANQMAQLGFWWDSTGLREAALLIRPDSVEQRLKLIGDYGQAIASEMPEVAAAGDWKFDDAPTLRAIERRVDAYVARLSHVEHLIRNRSVPVQRAVELAARSTQGGVSVPLVVGTINGQYRRLGQEELIVVEEAKEQFITQVMPELLAWIDAQPGNKARLLENWQQTVVAATLMRWDRTYRTKEELDFIRRVLTQVVPDLLPTAFQMTQFLSSHGKRYPMEHKGVKTVTEEDWLNFLGELEKSGHRVCNIYGRFGKIRSQYQRGVAKTPDELRTLLAQIDSLLKDYAETPFRVPTYQPRTKEWMYSGLHDTRTYVAAELKRMEQPAQAVPPPQWATPKQEDPKSMGRLRFEVIDLKVRRKDDQTVSAKGVRYQVDSGWGGIQHLVPCGESLDVWWQPGAILFMRNKGFLDEVFLDNKVYFDDVRWDGNAVWIATRHAGVWVAKPDGTITARFTSASGLPPADDGILIQPLANGTAIAVGSLGPLARAWCALLTPDGRGGGSVKVFHEATRVEQADEGRAGLDTNPALCFRPHWLHLYQSKDAGPTILVGRYTSQGPGRRRPLEINPSTQEVRVFGRQLYDADDRWSDSYFSRVGFLLEADTMGVSLRPPPGDRFEDGSEYREMCSDRPDRNVVGAQGAFTKQLLAYKGWVYAPGGTWWRIDPNTWKPERLVPWRVPGQYESLRHFGVSAHYGLVAWDDQSGTFYNVTVAPE